MSTVTSLDAGNATTARLITRSSSLGPTLRASPSKPARRPAATGGRAAARRRDGRRKRLAGGAQRMPVGAAAGDAVPVHADGAAARRVNGAVYRRRYSLWTVRAGRRVLAPRRAANGRGAWRQAPPQRQDALLARRPHARRQPAARPRRRRRPQPRRRPGPRRRTRLLGADPAAPERGAPRPARRGGYPRLGGSAGDRDAIAAGARRRRVRRRPHQRLDARRAHSLREGVRGARQEPRLRTAVVGGERACHRRGGIRAVLWRAAQRVASPRPAAPPAHLCDQPRRGERPRRPPCRPPLCESVLRLVHRRRERVRAEGGAAARLLLPADAARRHRLRARGEPPKLAHSVPTEAAARR